MNGNPLEQIEKITHAMQETAAREDWDHLAEQERLRITLVDGFCGGGLYTLKGMGT